MSTTATRIRADFSQRHAVELSSLVWQPSPISGVERRMLDRVGDEVARATSVVRYQPGGRFPEHTHDLGEEFFVLDGVFADERGRYPAGTYVRNPPGSSHAPFTDDGCTIFVKLRQFDPRDSQRVVIDTMTAGFRPGVAPGLSVLPLHDFEAENVAVVRWAPGTVFHDHMHPGGEEIFVLEGSLDDEHGHYPTHTWIRSPSGSRHKPHSEDGCTILVKVGHLPP